MNDIKRHIDNTIKSHFTLGRQVLLLLGARQVGKTTLIKRLFPKASYYLLDSNPVLKNFETYDINSYKQFIPHDSEYVIIDEMQLLSDPGRVAKIIYDQMPDIKLIITGSSALDIKNKTSESLAGRKLNYHLYPLTFSEYLYQTGVESSLETTFLEDIIAHDLSVGVHLFDLRSTLVRILTYGLHPYLVDHSESKEYLKELAASSIYKDIIELNLIENRQVASDLLKLLAYQVGNLINYTELASRLNIDVRTVKRYIEIFEQSFIIFRLYPFTSRRRDEVGKAPKIYFYDLGLRNAVIDDFTDPFLRREAGALFENFIISESLKHNAYKNLGYQLSFWRTTQGSEVDLILHKKDEIVACEIKMSKGQFSSAFGNRFPDARKRMITMENFW